MLTRRNLAPNPSFETNLNAVSPWGGSGGTNNAATRGTDGGAFGTGYFRLTWSVAPSSGGGVFSLVGSDTGPALKETQYTHSVYIRSNTALTMYVQVQYYKNGTPTLAYTGPNNAIPGTSTWTRLSWTCPTPPSNGDNKMSVRFYVSGAGVTTSTILDFDAILFEEGSVLNDFFDGRSSKDGWRYSWTGAVDNSEAVAEQISVSTFRRNTVRNPKQRANMTDWAFAVNGGVASFARMTDGNLVIPETGQVITTYYRGTWTTAPAAWASTGPLIGTPTVDGITIVGGLTHVISCYARTNHLDRTARLTITFHDAAGVQSSYITSGPIVTIGGTNWVRVSCVVNPPPGVVRAYVRCYSSGGTEWVNGETFDCTAVLCEQTDILKPYFDGDTGTVNQNERSFWSILSTPDASQSVNEVASGPAGSVRINLCTNPNFESVLTGWSGANGATLARDITMPHSGSYSCKITHAAGAGITSLALMTVTGLTIGKTYTFSAWLYVPTGVNDSTLWISGKGTGTVVSVKDQWARSTNTIVATATSHIMYIATLTGTQAGQNTWFDDVMVEESSVANPYFDGASSDSTYKYAWYGSAHAAPSVQYQEVVSNLQRKNLAQYPGVETAAGWLTNNGTNWVCTDDTVVFRSGAKSRLSTPQAAAIGTQPTLLSMYNVGGNIPKANQGMQFTASVYLRHNSVRSGIVGYVSAYFLDAASTLIAAFAGPQIPMDAPNTWYRASILTPPAPPNATQVRILTFVGAIAGNVQAGELAWADDCLVESGSNLRDYFDGSTPVLNGKSYQWLGTMDASESIEVDTAPEARRNLSPNPGAMLNTIAFWNANSGAGGLTAAYISAPDGPVVKTSYKITWTANATVDTGGVYHGNSTQRYINVREGMILSASMYVRANRTQRIALFWYCYNAANAQIGQANGSHVVLNPNEWARLAFVNTKMPAAADHLIIAAYTLAGTGFSRWVIGDTLECQGLLVENSSTVDTYFDGDNAGGGLTSSAWTGTKYASESVLLAGSSNASRGDNIFASLVAAGFYSPPAFSSIADMERRRLLQKCGLSEPQSLSMADLYFRAGEKPRLVAFRK